MYSGMTLMCIRLRHCLKRIGSRLPIWTAPSQGPCSGYERKPALIPGATEARTANELPLPRQPRNETRSA